ncbi:putative chitooligosaccharide deacetylase [Phialemonium atrogriseum]|uniref:chitin deacetylase n=1 Tax=Phialemonium atrogriseum TaxID=1093897 RepID=A0AAJ0BUM2_9PEZI|nr:putative chitooligosaccharide deacetylase [Phialemonium atrogriseum]KAK1764605.1 putative chitooligosaccharide deacetylase [Phialemonium atrogriseum]
MLCIPSLLRLPSKFRRRARRRRMATLLALLAVCVLVLAPFYVVYQPPAVLIRFFARRWPDVLWEVPLPPPASEAGTGDNKLVALTIDDAPSSHTRGILEALAESDARATFFVIGGQVSGREEALAEVVRAGHELGNHGMHDEPARGLAGEELRDQIETVQGMIRTAYEAGGRAVPTGRYFRPGSGFFSQRMREVVAGMGYRLVLGGVYPHDAQIGYWWLNARHILSMVRPGAIIICHDRRSWTVPMLRKVLPELKRRGYRVVTVTELLEAAKGS